MRKNFLKALTGVIVLTMLLFAFVGCSFIDRIKGSNAVEKDPIELSENDGRVRTLIAYLEDKFTSYDLPDDTLERKIDNIKNGYRALHVKFDSENAYFICAYCIDEHDEESLLNCCMNEYTWVEFSKADKISEKYGDKKLVAAFQFNKSCFVKDIISEDATVPYIEHFLKYTPKFYNGLNTSLPIEFNDSFIYLDGSKSDKIYYSVSKYNYTLICIPCVDLDKVSYVKVPLYSVSADGDRNDYNISGNFGKYESDLAAVMQIGEYSEIIKNGLVCHYGTIKIDDFANVIKEAN